MIIKRKLAAVAILTALGVQAGLAQAGTELLVGPSVTITSDGRPGGSFWGQPIDTSRSARTGAERFAVGPTEVIPSDGRQGGAFWGSPRAVAASSEGFVGATYAPTVRPYSFLEDYNP